jgi:hypothetical protein
MAGASGTVSHSGWRGRGPGICVLHGLLSSRLHNEVYLVSFLEGAFEKLSRAYQHFVELDVALNAFSHIEAKRLPMNPSRQEPMWVFTDPYELASSGIPARQVRLRPNDGRLQALIPVKQTIEIRLGQVATPPLVEWGVMVGDIVHNLRSALDVMVWDLSVFWQARHGKALPPANLADLPKRDPGRKWRGIRFPVCVHEKDWKSHEAEALWAIDPEVSALFCRLQPWHTGKLGKRLPEREPLNVLHELWNADKHQTPSFISTLTQLQRMSAEPVEIDGYIPRWETRVVSDLSEPIPLKDNAKLATVEMTLLNPRVRVVKMMMRVNFRVDIQVAFEDCPPAYGARVGPMLSAMCDAVAELLSIAAQSLRTRTT